MKLSWYLVFIAVVFVFFHGLGRREAKRREAKRRIDLCEYAAREERRRCWNQEVNK